MKETITPKNSCPVCGHPFDCASDLLTDAMPKVGDISMCIECGAASVFTADLTSRAPTVEEMGDWDAKTCTRILLYQLAIRRVQALRK